jgi:hypothetical protein
MTRLRRRHGHSTVVVARARVCANTCVAGSQGKPGGDRGFATLHGLYWLTANLAAQSPLLVVVDDATERTRPR